MERKHWRGKRQEAPEVAVIKMIPEVAVMKMIGPKSGLRVVCTLGKSL